jgi:hypothetical protein
MRILSWAETAVYRVWRATNWAEKERKKKEKEKKGKGYGYEHGRIGWLRFARFGPVK